MSERTPEESAIAGASTALLAVLRARRPDLTWEIVDLTDEELKRKPSSGRSSLDLIRESADSSIRYTPEYQSKYQSKYQLGDR